MASPLPVALVQSPAQLGGELGAFADAVHGVFRQVPAARMIAFPELHLSTPGHRQDGSKSSPADLAEPLDGPRDQFLGELAGDLKVWLVPGSLYERGPDGSVYNTAMVYSPEGRRVAAYRKIAPWRPYETSAPGSDFVVFDMGDYGRVGISICYDAWFPEISRHLAWMGADLIMNLVQTPTVDRDQEVVLARANAIVNQVFVASLNAATPTGLGHSLLVDPEGRVRVQIPGGEYGVLTDVLDLAEARRVRKHGTAGLNRLWHQFQLGDPPLALPLYSGKIDPRTWGAGCGGPE